MVFRYLKQFIKILMPLKNMAFKKCSLLIEENNQQCYCLKKQADAAT